VIFIVISCACSPCHPAKAVLLLLGLPITGFAMLQLGGVNLALRAGTPDAGGMDSGGDRRALMRSVRHLGPPLLVYLLPIKADSWRRSGCRAWCSLIGAFVLFFAHLHSRGAEPCASPFGPLGGFRRRSAQYLGTRIQDTLTRARFPPLDPDPAWC